MHKPVDKSSRLINSHNSLLVIIDVQVRLVPAIFNAADVTRGCAWLIELARDLDIPVLMTEQNPEGLGHTVAELRDLTTADERFSKQHFSCVSEPGFLERLNDVDARQIIVAGMEAHVCVMQTVLALLDHGYAVFPVSDFIGARRPADRSLALARVERAGAIPVSPEMLFFEWLHTANTDSFSTLLRKHITGDSGLDSWRS